MSYTYKISCICICEPYDTFECKKIKYWTLQKQPNSASRNKYAPVLMYPGLHENTVVT